MIFKSGDRVVFNHYNPINSGERELVAHNGQQATVVRPLTYEEAHPEDIGPMYRIWFDDGYESDVFVEEIREG